MDLDCEKSMDLQISIAEAIPEEPKIWRLSSIHTASSTSHPSLIEPGVHHSVHHLYWFTHLIYISFYIFKNIYFLINFFIEG